MEEEAEGEAEVPAAFGDAGVVAVGGDVGEWEGHYEFGLGEVFDGGEAASIPCGAVGHFFDAAFG